MARDQLEDIRNSRYFVHVHGSLGSDMHYSPAVVADWMPLETRIDDGLGSFYHHVV